MKGQDEWLSNIREHKQVDGNRWNAYKKAGHLYEGLPTV